MYVPADPPRRGLDRREVLALGAGAFLVACLPAVLRSRKRLVRRRIPVMGTIGEVAVVHADEARAHAAIDAAFDALRDVDATMSWFRADSDVGRVNRGGEGERVRVGAGTAAVLVAAVRWAQASDGRFDPCLGRAVDLWDVKARRAPPAEAVVRPLAGRALWRALDLDADAGGGGVRLRDPDASVDLGGIAKGYGVDRAVAALRAHGVEHGLVNVGGDLYALGASEDGDPWRVGVRDPADPDRLACTLDVADAAVATSGDYEQFFELDGRRYHHLLDPDTAAPRASRTHSVTVRAPTCLDADAAATAVFGLDATGGSALLARAVPAAALLA